MLRIPNDWTVAQFHLRLLFLPSLLSDPREPGREGPDRPRRAFCEGERLTIRQRNKVRCCTVTGIAVTLMAVSYPRNSFPLGLVMSTILHRPYRWLVWFAIIAGSILATAGASASETGSDGAFGVASAPTQSDHIAPRKGQPGADGEESGKTLQSIGHAVPYVCARSGLAGRIAKSRTTAVPKLSAGHAARTMPSSEAATASSSVVPRSCARHPVA